MLTGRRVLLCIRIEVSYPVTLFLGVVPSISILGDFYTLIVLHFDSRVFEFEGTRKESQN